MKWRWSVNATPHVLPRSVHLHLKDTVLEENKTNIYTYQKKCCRVYYRIKKQQPQTIGEFKNHISREKKTKKKTKKATLSEIFVLVLSHYALPCWQAPLALRPWVASLSAWGWVSMDLTSKSVMTSTYTMTSTPASCGQV